MGDSNSVADYLARKNHLLERLSLLENDKEQTKDKFIQELIQITIPMLDSGVIAGMKAEDTARYLWQDFDTHNVEVSYRHFIDQFPEDLKRKYSKSEPTAHLEHDFIKQTTLPDGTIVKRCECGKYEINGMEAQLKEPEVEEQEEDKQVAATAAPEPEREPSLILEANQTALAFLKVFTIFIKEFDAKCQNPKILKDLEASMEYRDLAKMMLSLQALFEPPMDKMFHEGATPSIMNQMLDETNFRAPATMLQKGMCKLLESLTSYRNWAHRLSVSPRQHQRIRERLLEWPEKKAEKIIEQVLGSFTCPSCYFNLVSLKANPGAKVTLNPKKMGKKLPMISYGDSKYEVPKKYQGKGMTPIDIAAEIFSGKIPLKK